MPAAPRARAIRASSVAALRPRGWPRGCGRLPVLVSLFAAAALAADDEAALEAENSQLQARLAALQTRLKEEEQYSYVVSKGMLVGSANVFMETMELVDAKRWCNSNPQCQGFTFIAQADGEPLQPEDEVTVTFKGEAEAGEKLSVAPDSAYVSYVKQSAASSALGAVGDAGMQLEGKASSLVGQWLGIELVAVAFALSMLIVFACPTCPRAAGRMLCGAREANRGYSLLPT